MSLDSENPAILALLVERIEQLTGVVESLKPLILAVNTNTIKIAELEKDNSTNHKGITAATSFVQSTKGGIKVLYAAMVIFTGIMGTSTGVAIGLFFKDSQALATISERVDGIRNDMNYLLGARK